MPSLQTETSGGAFLVALDRPPRNVLDLATIRELGARIAPLEQRRDLRTVVSRSALPVVFSAGVDVEGGVRAFFEKRTPHWSHS